MNGRSERSAMARAPERIGTDLFAEVADVRGGIIPATSSIASVHRVRR